MPISPDVLAKYKNRVFVETGTFLGDGVQAALDAGFEEVRSIEVYQPNYLSSVKRFINDPRVKIWYGGSGQLLGEMLKDLNEPVTFWLDAHCSGEGTGMAGNTLNPILAELKHIDKHPVKTHTILIDDRRLFGTYEFEHVTEAAIIDKLWLINEDYIIGFEDGFQKNDILVAHHEL